MPTLNMNGVHPLIQHTPSDAGNVSIPALHVLSETTSSWNNVAFCKKQANDAYFSGTCNTVVAVPLMHKNQVMGVYNLFLDEGHSVPEDVRILFRSIGEHLGIALENARLTRENMRISLMNERQMLANQIHDSLAQTLAYAKMRPTLLSHP